MKVLQLGKFYPIRGGVEKVMWDITRGLAGRGIPCDMLCAMLRSDGIDAPHRSMAAETGDGMRVISFGLNNRVFCVPAWTKKAGTMLAPAMIRWLRRHSAEYDIIHIHHPDPMAALALWLSGYKGRVILHWHSDIVSQKFFLFFFRPLQSWLIRRAECIVGTTPVYLKASKALSRAQEKCCCIPIGIEPIEFISKNNAFRAQYQNKKIIFALGRLVPYKGFDCLVRAAAFLDDDYVVLIGGSGPLREQLESQIRSLGLEGKVKLLGYVRDESLPLLYNACDVFVMSSQMKTEAFGIVQIEAMSCGKPVVATIIPESGVSWVNEHGVSGLNVAPQDAEAMAAAISRICAGEESYRNYSAGAKARYEACFTFSGMIDNIVTLYENEKI